MTVSNVNVSAATINTYVYIATGSETSKTGADSNGATLSYTPGKEQVFLNGALLVRGTDYTATDGSSITGLTALAASDILEIVSFSPFNVANAVQASNFAAKGDLVAGTGASTFTNLSVGTNGQVLTAASGQTTGLQWATPTVYSAPTLGSTSIASGATVSTISALTANNLTLTGTLTANSSTGTSGQYLQSTSTGVQWASASASPVFPATATSSNITLASGNSYMVDTTAARTLTLPASPALGSEIHIFDSTGNSATNNITVANNSSNINGQATTLTIDKAYAAVNLVYVGSAYGWRVS
jgi:hypothetical protein